MKNYFFLLSQIWHEHSVLRAYLNLRLLSSEFRGKVIDIGCGGNLNYLNFLDLSKIDIQQHDKKMGESIDFETDVLPYEDGSFDTVLFLNVMEHIYNHKHIANEVLRVTKANGKVIGYVPFLMWYHPDPQDYFRYTEKSLEKIFQSIGAKQITIEAIAPGPFSAASHMVLLSIPRIVRPLLFTINFLLDAFFIKLRPGHNKKYVLGYYFELIK